MIVYKYIYIYIYIYIQDPRCGPSQNPLTTALGELSPLGHSHLEVHGTWNRIGTLLINQITA